MLEQSPESASFTDDFGVISSEEAERRDRVWLAGLGGRRLKTPRQARPVPSVARWLTDRSSEAQRRAPQPQPLLPRLSPAEQFDQLLPTPSRLASPSSSSRQPRRPSETSKGDNPGFAVNLLGAATKVKSRQIHRRVRMHHALSSEVSESPEFEEIDKAADEVLSADVLPDRQDMQKGKATVFEQYANGAIIGPGSVFSFPAAAGELRAAGVLPAPPPEGKKGRRGSSNSQVKTQVELPIQTEAEAEAQALEDLLTPAGDSQPTMLPREPVRSDIKPGAVATVHASRFDANRVLKMTDRSLQSERASADSMRGQTWSNWSSRANLHTPADRKWHLRQASLSANMAKQAGKRHTLPGHNRISAPEKSTGQSDLPGKVLSQTSEYLSFCGWGIDDEYASSLSRQIQFSNLRHIHLTDNRLTETWIRGLVDAFRGQPPLALESLLLAQNRLGQTGGLALARLFKGPPDQLLRTNLKELDLADNNLGDTAAAEICEVLQMRCHKLVGLSLAKNRLGEVPKVGAAIGALIGASLNLQALDLHWNKISGADAYHIFNGFYDNSVQIPGQLTRVNMAWNSIGDRCVEGKTEKTQETEQEQCKCEACRNCSKAVAMLAQVLQDCNTLFHLDLSYNSLCACDCKTIGDSLHSNHSLFGLHLIGNEATVDDVGFVWPRRVREEVREDLQELRKREGLRLGLDKCIRSTPRKFALDRIGQFSDGQSPVLKRAYEFANPSLHRVEKGDAFSEEDLRHEKEWLGVHAKVQPPSLFNGRNEFEEVRINTRCCWICENWVEEVISYIPGWSGSEISAEDVTEVFAYFSIDGFARPTRLMKTTEKFHARQFQLAKGKQRKKNGKRASGNRGVAHVLAAQDLAEARLRTPQPFLLENGLMVVFKGGRMLPPSSDTIRVIFQVNNRIVCADHLAKVHLSEPVGIALHCSGCQSSHEPMPPTPELLDPEDVDLRVWASEANEVNVRQDAGNLFEQGLANALCLMEDPRLRGGLKVVPRMLQSVENAVEREWEFQTSLFRDYQQDTDEVVKSCFTYDHQLTRLDSFWKRARKEYQVEPAEIKSYLCSVYTQIMLAYAVESVQGFDQTRHSYGLSLRGFSKILQDMSSPKSPKSISSPRHPTSPKSPKRSPSRGSVLKRTSIAELAHRQEKGEVYSQGFTLEKSDTCYIAASAVDDASAWKQLEGQPQKGLTRFQFLEAIVRTSLARYEERRLLKPIPALKKFIEELGLGHEPLRFRKSLHKALFCEDCDLIIRQYKQRLEKTFQLYCKRLKLEVGTDQHYMSFGAWVEFMQAWNDDPEIARRAFVLGKQFDERQHETLRHMSLSWSEFIVCVGAAVRLIHGEKADLSDGMLDFFEDHLATVVKTAHEHSLSATHVAVAGIVKQYKDDPKLPKVIDLMTQVFEQGDLDSSGFLTFDEFAKVLEVPAVLSGFHDCELESVDLKLLFYRIDTDGSHTVNLEEFVGGILKLRKDRKGLEPGIRFLRKAFADIDVKRTGEISKSKYNAYMKDPSKSEALKRADLKESDIDDLWVAAKQAGLPGPSAGDNTADVTMEALVGGLIDLANEKGNIIRGLNYLKQICVVADLDQSGTLDREEVRKYLCRDEVTVKLTSLNLFVPDWIHVFEMLDENGDGVLTRDELENTMKRMWSEVPAQRATTKSSSSSSEDEDGEWEEFDGEEEDPAE
eukprot:TRINITY_DN32604_c0_g1_i1.p1 TRINITY_DN32604_c0_g1~~TRINITY_DN32604_c0_g1_i1.p1  ORF type:complete len:1681 (+),score=315.31 TRINITY_DN32604_c0_g1_i1:55-5097(+)